MSPLILIIVAIVVFILLWVLIDLLVGLLPNPQPPAANMKPTLSIVLKILLILGAVVWLLQTFMGVHL